MIACTSPALIVRSTPLRISRPPAAATRAWRFLTSSRDIFLLSNVLVTNFVGKTGRARIDESVGRGQRLAVFFFCFHEQFQDLLSILGGFFVSGAVRMASAPFR